MTSFEHLRGFFPAYKLKDDGQHFRKFICNGKMYGFDKIIVRLHNIDMCYFKYESLMKEPNILRQLRHPNVVPILDTQLYASHYLLIRPFFDCGSLKARIINRYMHGFCEPVVIFVLQQLFSALEYLHARHFVHRGIKCCNILACAERGKVVLAGFGNASSLIDNGVVRKSLHDYNENMMHDVSWLAPEVLDQGRLGYTIKSDIYMIGATIIEMCNGLEPYFDYPPYKIMLEKRRDQKPMLIDKNTAEKVTDASYPLKSAANISLELTERDFSRDLHKLTAFCLNFNPVDRLSIGELRQKFHKLLNQTKLNDGELHQLFEPLSLIDQDFKISENFLEDLEEESNASLDWQF